MISAYTGLEAVYTVHEYGAGDAQRHRPVTRLIQGVSVDGAASPP
jgi:hypothetical protein